MKSSTKQRIECFQSALGNFHASQKQYLSNRKQGRREPKKQK